ncbi:unnamed protein product [Effrenium voratum]|uniref:Clavaminate synthase-like protein n=1 Tax=Effrenium voratum TaxID=2562239 RepID=A0AA36JEM3_9DINO|nr:unnamed protein product [Effrenium voratum]CAJ1437250.1 unnamed protein product [Effrenium voratum]
MAPASGNSEPEALIADFAGFYKSEVQQKPGERFKYDFGCFIGGLRGCLTYFCLPPCSPVCRTTFKNMMKQQPRVPVKIYNAREKQAQEGLSTREFFERYGFVLVEHHTKMTSEDWLANTSIAGVERSSLIEDSKSALRQIYAKELEPLIRELLPKSGQIFYPKVALRRGPGGPNPHYGLGVHQDFGLYPEDLRLYSYKLGGDFGSFEEFKSRLAEQGTAGVCMLNFWRPVLPMKGPVKDTPLALCDPNTVNVEDTVNTELHGFVSGGMASMGLKFNADQKWYYYSDVTTKEVIVFRQFIYSRDVDAPYKQLRTVFHSAFRHPNASKDDEPRCSSEYRLGVWLT